MSLLPLVPSGAVVVDDLPLHDPLTLIVPMSRPAATLALPLVAELAFVGDLSEALLPARTDAVGDLHKLEDVLLY